MSYSGIQHIPIERRRNIINNLSESELWPLIGSILMKLKFNWVDITHGVDEHGRDLVGSASTTTGGKELVACVVKAGSISGGVSGKTTLVRVMDQVKLTFSSKYSGPNVRNPERINRVLVITNKTISNLAKKEISSLDIPYGSIEFWQIEQLEEKVSTLLPSFYLNIDPELYEYLISLKASCERVQDVQRRIHLSRDKKLTEIFVTLPIVEVKRGKTPHIEGKKKKKKDRSRVFDDLDGPVIIEDSDLLKPKKNYALVGGPGSGKTCLLRKTCIELIEKRLAGDGSLPLPLFLNAGELEQVSSNLDLQILLSKILCSEEFKVVFNDDFQEDCVYTLFIDGLDEVSTDESRSQIYDFLLILSSKFKTLKIIISSRPLQMWRDETPGDIQEGSILPIQRSAMADLLQKLISKPKKSAAILQELIKSEIFQKLPQTPLVVTLIALLHEEEEIPELPANLTDLYELFSMVYLERWTKEGQKYFDTKIAILELLALELHNRRKTELSISDLIAVTEKYLADKGIEKTPEVFVDEIIRENLLLVCHVSNSNKTLDDFSMADEKKLYPENCWISFVHKSFQEFFVARYLKRRPSESEKILVQNFDDPWWGSIGMFFSGFVKDIPNLIQGLIKTPKPGGPLSISRMVNLGQTTQAATQTDLNLRIQSCEHGGVLLADGYDFGIDLNRKYGIKMSRFQLVGALCWMYEQAYCSYHLIPSLKAAFTNIMNDFSLAKKLSNDREKLGLSLLGMSWALANSGELDMILQLAKHLDESDGVLTVLLTLILEDKENIIKNKNSLSHLNLERREEWLKSIKSVKKRVKRYKDLLVEDMNKEAVRRNNPNSH